MRVAFCGGKQFCKIGIDIFWKASLREVFLMLRDVEHTEILYFELVDGPIAQLVERIVCNDEVSSSNLLGSTPD